MTPHNSMDNANNYQQQLPQIGHDVRVRHNGLERRAYRDGDGNWRDAHDGSVLRGEVQILEVD